MGTHRRAGLAPTLLFFMWACSGSEFNGAAPSSSSIQPNTQPDAGNGDAGEAGSTGSTPSAGGGGSESGSAGSDSGHQGGEGGEVTIDPAAGAGGQIVDPGCQGLMVDCDCVEGRCGPGLACGE